MKHHQDEILIILVYLLGMAWVILNPSLTLWGNFHKFLVIFSS